MTSKLPSAAAARVLGATALLAIACSPSPPASEAGDSPGLAGGAPRDLDPPALQGAMAPRLASSRSGVLLTWLEPIGVSYRLRFARLEGDAWSKPVTIVSGGDFFANWADVPSVAESPDGALLAHWLARNGPGTYAYGIELARSTDGGATWERLGPLQDDVSPTEHGFVSLVPDLIDGRAGFRAVWLDGRETVDEGAPMTLRTTRVTDRAEPSELLDARVCDCCPTAAVVAGGGVVVAYRDRTPEEVRDVHVLRLGPEGAGEPYPVHPDGWVFSACPVNGPALAAAGDRVVLAWFTGAGDLPRVLAAFSADGGRSFGEPVEIAREGALGRVGVAMTGSAGEAVVSWLATQEGQGVVHLRRLSETGALGEPLRLAETSASRTSGVPRLLGRGDLLWAAWVESGEDEEGGPSRLRVREIPVAELPAPGR